MNDVENTAGDGFAPEEKAYFDSRGEVALPAEEKGREPGHDTNPPTSSDEEGQGEAKDKVVPHGAFHEERQRRKQAEEKFRALEIENAKAIARLETLLQGGQGEPKQDELPLPPKPEEDIFGAVDYQGKRVETVEQELTRFKQEREREAMVQNVLRASHAQEKVFMEANPDYPEALNHLRESRVAELIFFGADEATARARVGQEEINVAAHALQSKRNPAEVIYELAAKRGYAKKAPPQPDQDPAKKLEAIEAAQAANKSLSSTGGGASSGTISAADLLKMSDKEFEAFANSNPAKFRRIMAGTN